MKKFLIVPILIMGALFLFRDISRPLFGLHENNIIAFANMARNISQNGLLATKFCGSGYIDHPCGVQVILSFFYILGGVSDFTTRLAAVFFSLGLIFIFYLFCKKLYGIWTALTACLILIFLPSFVTFGDMFSHEIILLFFVFLTLYLFLIWFEKGKRKYFYLSLLTQMACLLIDWPGYYLWVILTVYLFLTKRRKDSLIFFAIGFFTLLSLLLQFLYISDFNFAGLFGTYLRLFLNRTQSIDGGYLALIQKIYFREKLLFTPIIIITSLFGLTLSFIRREKSHAFLLITFIFPLIHVLLFRGGWFQHFYWSYYFIPFLSIGSAYFLIFVIKKLPFKILGIVILGGFFIFYIKTSLRNINYFDSLYDKNLQMGVSKLTQQVEKKKVYLVTSQYSTLTLQYYLRDNLTTKNKADWAVAWILPDITLQEQKTLIEICQKYSCKIITEPGNYPMFKVAKLK